MARTIAEIEASLAASIEEEERSNDTQKGPIYDLMVRPQSAEIRASELRYDDLSRRYSLDYVLTQDPRVLTLYGSNHGLRPSAGGPSTGEVTLFTYSRVQNGDVLYAPAGTIVTTSDSAIAYRTLRDAYIVGSSIETFYSAVDRRYEVTVPVEAVGAGEDYDVPPLRVNTISSSLEGFDGVVNKRKISESTPEESMSRFGRRIRSKFNGLSNGSGAGLEQIVRNFDPRRIEDVSLIFSTDYENFFRSSRRSAWDLYLIGSASGTSEVSYAADGVTRHFKIPVSPVLSVSSVTVNGNPVSFTLISDSSYALRGSTRAEDMVELASIPGVNEIVSISYVYDQLIVDVQSYVDRTGVQLYDTDVLVRKAIPVPLTISATASALSSFDTSSAESSMYSSASEFVGGDSFVSQLSPEGLRDSIASNTASVSSVVITSFTRKNDGTLPVEVVEFAPYEYPDFTSSDVSVRVKR